MIPHALKKMRFARDRAQGFSIAMAVKSPAKAAVTAAKMPINMLMMPKASMLLMVAK